MAAAEPQAIVSAPTEAAIFLVLTAVPGSEEEIAGLLADASGLKRFGWVPGSGGRTVVRGRDRGHPLGSA